MNWTEAYTVKGSMAQLVAWFRAYPAKGTVAAEPLPEKDGVRRLVMEPQAGPAPPVLTVTRRTAA